jgi:hypothetical protein
MFSVVVAAQQKQTICSINAIPAGWMTTDVIKNCSSYNGKTGWNNKNLATMKVGSVVKVCVFNNPPPGWKVTQNIYCTCCGVTVPSAGNQWEIKKVSQ